MPNRTISIRRVLLGMVFVALPFSAFSGFGPQGIIVATVIAVAMFTACCTASRDQLQSMFGIIACTVGVVFVGSLFSGPSNRREPASDLILYASVGMAVGILWSEHFYSVKKREQSPVKEEEDPPKDNDHSEEDNPTNPNDSLIIQQDEADRQ